MRQISHTRGNDLKQLSCPAGVRDAPVLYRDPDYCVKGMITGLQMAVGFPYFRLPSRISLDTGTPIDPIFSRSRSTRSIKALFGFRFSPAI
jgi:hypothetical protein